MTIGPLFFRTTVAVGWSLVANQDVPFEHEILEKLFTNVSDCLLDLGKFLVQVTQHSEILTQIHEILGFSTQRQVHRNLFDEIEKVIENFDNEGNDKPVTITEAYLQRMKLVNSH